MHRTAQADRDGAPRRVADLLVGPLIEGIMRSEVDDAFQEHLLTLHRKLGFIDKNEAAQYSAAYRC